MTVFLYHGGIHGLSVGDLLVPSPPHVTDGCPVCVARSEGRTLRVGEYRQWLVTLGDRAKPLLSMLADADDAEPMDPPSGREAVYLTSDRTYARWYAARSKGDLYRATPVGRLTRSTEDTFPTWTADSARVVEVVERNVRLQRAERRALLRAWIRADAARGAA